MDAGAFIVVGLGLVATTVLVVGGLILFSRLAGGQQHGAPVQCWIRTSNERGWTPGRLRYNAGQVHFRGRSMFAPRRHHWERQRLVLGTARPAPSDFDSADHAWVTWVQCDYGTFEFELILDDRHYVALRSWTESVPPGWNSNVA